MNIEAGRRGGAQSGLPVEDEREREEQVRDIARRFRCLDRRNAHIRERRREEQECPHQQEHEDTATMDRVCRFGVLIESNGVAPAL